MSATAIVARGHRFRAMGCEIVVGGGSASDHAAVERMFSERDWIFSRFVPDSELNRVNDAAGRFVPVSDLFADTLRTALRVAEETDGVVDPTLGAAIESAGYTRDFAMLEPDDRPPGAPVPGSWRRVLVFGRHVGNPLGVRLDLNGVVKAIAVDDALALLPGRRLRVRGGRRRGPGRARGGAAGRRGRHAAPRRAGDERRHRAALAARQASSSTT